MRIFAVFTILCSVSHPLIAQDTCAEISIGESLVKAIAADDVVAYSQCWICSRRMAAKLKGVGIDLPAEEAKKMREYHALRNKDIAESFQKIQSLIDRRSIDRQSFRLKTCKAESVRDKKAPKGTVKQAGGFSVVLSVGTEEWRFKIDDGVMDNGLWYFSDSPTNLFAGDTTLSFRDHRDKADKSLNRSGG